MPIQDIVLPVTIQNMSVAAGGYLLFLAFTFLASKLFPGYNAVGLPELGKGRQKTYKFNGALIYASALITVFSGWFMGYVSLLPIIAYFWNLVIVANAVLVVMTVILTTSGRIVDPKEQVTAKRSEGNFFTDIFSGSQLNPELLGVDLKIWTNRPGLIGMVIISLSFAEYQYTTYSHISLQMLGFQALFVLYVAGHYLQEDFLLYAYDVLSEYYGLKLLWGANGIMPFLYTIPGWYLADQAESCSCLFFIIVMTYGVGGGVLAKISDIQKFSFRAKGESIKIGGKPVRVIKTETRSLLASGLWSISRHMNYCGEIMLFFAIALLAGFSHWQPYICPAFIFLVLVSRANEDDLKCRKKYGKYWEEYCSIAKYKVFPYIY